MTDAPRPIRTRPRWPWIVGALAVLVVLVVVFALTAPRGGDDRALPATNTPAPTATRTDAPGAVVSGCIGGRERDAAMLVAAQKAAPHTADGAASFAAAFVRWLYQYPTPPASDVQTVAQRIYSAEADSQKVIDYLGGSPNLSGGLVPDKQAFYVSTVPGVYYVESATPNKVSVSVGGGLVTDGALSATLRESVTVTAQWENGAWHVVESKGTRTTQDLFAIGTAFSGGC
jgi:hypothetical protein